MTLANSDNPSALIRSDRRGRLLVRAEQRTAILEAFDSSSLSGMAFCRQHGLSYSTFATWVQRRRKENNANPTSPVRSPQLVKSRFAEVCLEQTAPIAASRPPLGLSLPSGATVEISDSAQIPLLAELLRHLSSARPC